MRRRPGACDGVEEYLRGLGVACPAGFLAERVALYRFTHPSRTGPWWQALRWEPVRSFRLPGPG